MTEKVRENRLRRMAQRQGYMLLKSRRRDPKATDYGEYTLVTHGGLGGTGYALGSLDRVEEWLNRQDEGDIEPSWRRDPAVRGAAFRISRPGLGETSRTKLLEAVEALAESRPLPPPLGWSLGGKGSGQIAEIVRRTQGGNLVALVSYKYTVHGVPEGGRPDFFFWCLDEVCDTSQFAPCGHQWWRYPNEHLEARRIVTLKCAKCMTDDYVRPEVAQLVRIHGVMPKYWAAQPGSFSGGRKGEPPRPLPVWPPQAASGRTSEST